MLGTLLPLAVAWTSPLQRSPAHAVRRPAALAGHALLRARPRLSEGGEEGEASESAEGATADWREMRARLVAQERAAAQAEGADAPTLGRGDEGFVYESPLIEQGTVILGGTKQAFGFALRQQYFHKCVMLLLQHDERFTKGIILNRPSAYELDGWRVWFGGDVSEGGLFRGADKAKGEREIICLHALEGKRAERLSMPIIKGVSYSTLEGAKALVAEGAAQKSDFWVFVGYAGWAPSQLQGEVERDSWFLASADSGTLLKELLRQGTELPPPSDGAPPGDGLETWEKLMGSIGKSDEVQRTRGCLSDRMLTEWCRVRLSPPKGWGDASADGGEGAAALAAASTEELPVVEGTVLRAGTPPADRFLLNDQFLHKALMLCLHELKSDGTWIVAVLNRPTANLVQFHADGRPRRCISFGGDGRLRGGSVGGLEIDSNGLLWLGQAEAMEAADGGAGIGVAVGESGLRRVPPLEAAESIKLGETRLDDFLLVDGLICFSRNELRRMLDAGEVHVVSDPAPLWPQTWALSDARNVEEAELGDGTGVWFAAAQLDSGGGGGEGKGGSFALPVVEMGGLADEALDEWLKFFAGHKRGGKADGE